MTLYKQRQRALFLDDGFVNASSCAGPHSEAKQTGRLEFGAEKGLLQHHAKRWVTKALKNPEGLLKTLLKAK